MGSVPLESPDSQRMENRKRKYEMKPIFAGFGT